MLNAFSRTELLLGKEAMQKLKDSKIAIFGIGGVGGNVVDALARSGVGHFVLIDDDTVSLTNINRQLVANVNTIGRKKTEVMKEHILSINPDAEVTICQTFYLPENSAQFDFSPYDYCVDAIDTVTAKIDIILQCQKVGTPIISSMGAGNRLDPFSLRIGDLFSTSMDPLAKVMRRELRKRGVKSLKVLYSVEKPTVPSPSEEEENDLKKEKGINERSGKPKRSIPGSTSFVPPVAGIMIASEIIKDLTGFTPNSDKKEAEASK